MTGLLDAFAPQLLRIGRAIHRRSPGYSDAQFENEPCPACGASEGMKLRGVLWPNLVLQWRLTPAWANWVDQREGLQCRRCRSNLRSRQLAKTVVDQLNVRLGTHASSLAELCQTTKMQQLTVAEINAAGDLHPFLKQLDKLYYSEYGSKQPGVRSEDLQNLSYPDENFDLILNSDVLEHVPDVERALSEIHRVLKKDGLHVFSVPIIWKQATSRRRAYVEAGQLVHLLPPSHHGAEHDDKNDFLVFHEFGQDFIQLCERIGFSVKLVKDHRNPSLITLITQRSG